MDFSGPSSAANIFPRGKDARLKPPPLRLVLILISGRLHTQGFHFN